MKRFCNWGRWGETDERGTLNFITADSARAAAVEVLDGHVISCARTISPVSARRHSAAMQHHMTGTGTEAPPKGRHNAHDWFGMDIHGLAFTHLDAPSHVFWNAHTYNGVPAGRVGSLHGAQSLSVDVAGGGIVTRGVLLDLPRWRGSTPAPGEQLRLEVVRACEDGQGAPLRPGDALVLRVGRDLLDTTSETRLPGLHPECLEYLYEQEVSLVVCDGVTDPTGAGTRVPAVHTVGLVGMGLWLVDNAALEELAAACAIAGRWSFQLVVAPLRLKNATGSPVNPLAIL